MGYFSLSYQAAAWYDSEIYTENDLLKHLAFFFLYMLLYKNIFSRYGYQDLQTNKREQAADEHR